MSGELSRPARIAEVASITLVTYRAAKAAQERGADPAEAAMTEEEIATAIDELSPHEVSNAIRLYADAGLPEVWKR